MKNKFLKVTSLLLTILMMISASSNLFAKQVFAETKASSDISQFTYLVNGEEITITGYTGNAKSLTIPDVIDGKAVTALKESAFLNCFEAEEIILPESLKSIGYSAFNGCYSLKEIVIPASVSELSPNVFSNCVSLEKVTLNEGLNSISAQVFENCVSLKEIVLPESLQVILDLAFEGCIGLTKIHLPAKVTFIEASAFYKCTGITQITVDKSNANYHVSGNCLINKNDKLLLCGFNNSIIPSDDSVEYISNYAFNYMDSLKEINIPASIKEIYVSAFAGCGAVEKITVDKANENYHVSGNCLIETQTKRLIKGTNASTLTSDGSIEEISAGAFENCTGLKRIDIPASVNNIANSAFYGCCNVETINVDAENTVFTSEGNCLIRKDWGNILFGCYNSVIPANTQIKRIKNRAFYGCTELTKITIPDNIKEIGNYAFSGCTKLKEVVLSNSITKIPQSAFEGCEALESIEIPSGVKVIENGAFKDCTNLKSVTLPYGISTLSTFNMVSGAFENCVSLESITLPKTLQTIGFATFKGCLSLKTVIMSDKRVTEIKLQAFYGCDSLKNVYYPATKNDWAKINIDKGNDALDKYNINYFCDMKAYYESEMIAVSYCGMSVESFMLYASDESNASVALANGAEKQSGIFCTGDKLTVYGYTYDVVVKGDLDGSGIIDTTDIIMMKRDMLNINKLSGVYRIAADIDDDAAITSTDYITLKMHMLKISDINDIGEF